MIENYIVLDTETTEIENPRMIQLAFLVFDATGSRIEEYCNYCKSPPETEISYQAMAVHHITPEMIEDASYANQTAAYEVLESLNRPENILIIHNAKFDLKVLENEGFQNQMQIIDTLKVVENRYDYESYSLQYLRYRLGLYKSKYLQDKNISAHDALSDVWVLGALLNYMLKDEEHTIQALKNMVELSKKPVLKRRFDFGKYKGTPIEEIANNDPGYLQWCLAKIQDMDKDLRYSIIHYLTKPVSAAETEEEGNGLPL